MHSSFRVPIAVVVDCCGTFALELQGDQEKGLIVIGHALSEEPGMVWLAEWLKPRLPRVSNSFRLDPKHKIWSHGLSVDKQGHVYVATFPQEPH